MQIDVNPQFLPPSEEGDVVRVLDLGQLGNIFVVVVDRAI